MERTVRGRDRETGARQSPQSGFTLVEILVVLAIIGAVAIVTVPYILAGMPGLQLRAAADDMAATLQGLHEQAIRERVTTELTLDPETREFRTSSRPAPHALPKVVTRVAFSTAAIRPDDTVARLRFYADGTSSGGTIRLEHEALSASVVVDWLTGRVSRHD